MPGTELFGEEEKKEVMDVMNSGVLFRFNHDAQREGHWKAKDFEKEVAQFTGAQHALAVSSGSTAVNTMLAACGVGYGDEVIVPPFTYIATIEAVLLAGALPVFAEIDDTLCMSAEGIRTVLSPKTKRHGCRDSEVHQPKDQSHLAGTHVRRSSRPRWHHRHLQREEHPTDRG